eukprot:m.108131 g.108131  ORF g.108131 m.108131 type:complete len:102 (+) comp21194_c1_seq1:203-508(+)
MPDLLVTALPSVAQALRDLLLETGASTIERAACVVTLPAIVTSTPGVVIEIGTRANAAATTDTIPAEVIGIGIVTTAILIGAEMTAIVEIERGATTTAAGS